MTTNGCSVSEWKPQGLPKKVIKPPTISDNSLAPGLNFINSSKIHVKFERTCLKQDKIFFDHEAVVNSYILLELKLGNVPNFNSRSIYEFTTAS